MPGVRGLVVKLDGELARIEHDDGRLICGGGARLPKASARAATLGLAGLEFGVNIPGTVGGAVRMNANAYGGELGRVLDWVDVSTPDGTGRRRPEALGFAYRRSNLGPREIVARAAFSLERSDPDSVKAVLADMRARRKEAAAVRDQDLRLDLQEPRRRARRGPQRGPAARGGRLQGPSDRRCAIQPEARQLHRERRRAGEHRRRARADRRRAGGECSSASASSSNPRCSCSARPASRARAAARHDGGTTAAGSLGRGRARRARLGRMGLVSGIAAREGAPRRDHRREQQPRCRRGSSES